MTPPNFLKILNEKEKQEILKKLNRQFGIKEISGIISMRGKERLFLFQGNLTPEKIKQLERARINLERLGVYFAKPVAEKIRLSIEGTHIFKNQITKNIFELDDEQAELWMKGNELNISTGKNDFVVIKHNGNFLGCGKASAEKITNFIPKNRRLKK